MRWLARCEEHLPSGTGWLAPSEQARAAGMRYTKRHTEYLLRRFAAKSAVAAAVGMSADPETLVRIEVRNAPSGAPYVLVDGSPLGMDVSLTDRAGWAVCLIGQDLGAVGCDLELVEPRSDGFVRDFLTEAEQRWVAEAAEGRRSDDGRHLAANLLWSAKESALKVLRTGLRRDTRTVEVTIETPAQATAGWSPLRVRCVEGPVFPGWWRRDGAFLLTVVADAATPPPVALEGIEMLAHATPRDSWLSRPLRPHR